MDAFYTFFYQNFIEVLQYEFFQRSVISSLLISVITAIISVVVVNKNWSMLGMGLSNSIFPGVVIGLQFSFPLALTTWAFITGLSSFHLTNFIVRHSKLKTDVALGMCYTCFFAIGLVLLAVLGATTHATHILFGNLLGIEDKDYYGFLIVTAIVLVFSVIKFKDIMLFTFDERQFKILGLNYKLFYNFMLFILTLTIIVTLQAVGILLTISYLVLPTAIGQLISKKLPVVIGIALASNLIASYFGITFAYIFDIATGPSIVVLQGMLFIGAYVYYRLHKYYIIKTSIKQKLQCPISDQQ